MAIRESTEFVTRAVFDVTHWNNNIYQARKLFADFASGVSDGMDTIDGKGDLLKGLASSLRNANLGGLVDSIETVASRFTTLGIVGTAALVKITQQAVEAGEKIVSALTIDQVTAGWQKYENKTTAVQTIMAATANKIGTQFRDVGEQMEYVNQQLDKLNWFTDETSYNFVDMVSTIGKFTSNNVALEEAVTSMQGIATWAAISGQNASTASHVMEQLAQALGAGYIKGQDWVSVQGANMATAEFKQTVIETAVEMGKLQKVGENTFKAINAKATKNDPHTFTIENMAAYMSTDKWFTVDILNKVLDKYGSFTNQVYELTQATDLSATNILTLVEHFKNGSLTAEEFEEALSSTSYTAEEFSDILANLGSAENDFGYKALKAAQEAKTLSDAVGSVKEAASTAWMNIFETLFGDYEGQRKMWTDLANYLYEVFVYPLEMVQDTLDAWASKGGQSSFIKALYKIGPSLLSFTEPLKAAFNDVFYPMMDYDQKIEKWSNSLLEFTKNFSDFFDKIKMGEVTSDRVYRIFTGLFTVFKSVKSGISSVAQAFNPLISSIKELGGELLEFVADIADFISSLNLSLKIGEKITPAINRMVNAVKLITSAVTDLFSKIQNSYREGGGGISGLFKVIRVGIGSSISLASDLFRSLTGWGFESILSKISGAINLIIDSVEWLIKKLTGISIFKKTEEDMTKVSETSDTMASKIQSVGLTFDQLKEKIRPVSEFFAGLKESISGGIAKVIDWIGRFGEAIISVDFFQFQRMKWILTWIKELFSLKVSSSGSPTGLTGALTSIAGSLTSVFSSFTAWNLSGFDGVIMSMAEAVGILAVSLYFLSGINYDNLEKGVDAITALIIAITGAYSTIYAVMAKNPLKTSNPLADVSSLVDSKALKTAASTMVKMAAAVAILAYSLKTITSINYDKIVEGFVAMVSSMAALVGVIWALSKMDLVGIGKAGASFLLISVGVLALAGAMKIFSTINWQDAIVAFTLFGASVIVVVAAIAILTKVASATCGSLIAAAAALALVSTAMVVLAAAVLAFTLMANMEGFQNGVIGMAAALLAMVVALGLLGKHVEGTIAAAAALLILAVALDVVAVGLIALSLVPIDQLENALGVLIGTLIAMGLALIAISALSPGALVAAAALLVLSLALVASAASVLIFAVAMNMMDSIDWANIASGIDSMLLELLALSIVGVVMTAAFVGIIAMSVGLAAFGIALLALSPGISSLKKAGINEVAAGLTGLSIAGKDLGEAVIQVGSLGGALEVLRSAAKGSEKVFNNASGALLELSTSSTAAASEFSTFGNSVSIAETNVTVALENMVAICSTTAAQMTGIGIRMGSSFVSAISSYGVVALSAGVGLSYYAYTGANTYTGWFYTLGQNISIGLGNGINSYAWYVQQAANNVGAIAYRATANAVQSHSPSRLFMKLGKYIDQGLAIGMEREADTVASAGVLMAQSAIDAVNNILDTDETITITPVLDLSNVESGARGLSSMLSSDGAINMGAQIAGNLSSLQNADNGAMMVTLDPNAMAALTKNSAANTNVNVNFTGRLSQLAAVLQPAIEVESRRLGPSLIND